ncbi:MAG: serine/threonine-protein kinase [Proteobacteria bacterium]|nr:serine/threonine-protein kinase [Pseudomonadota bacterium]
MTTDALIGQTLIGKYTILRQIGRGGMGVVYEAKHVELGKHVAIKLMLEKYAEDGEAVARFKREALAASRIGNPHIIDIIDIGIAPDGRSFVVMQLLVGGSLAELLKQTGALPPARALDIMRQTLRAVGAAHAKHIVHRDLKPDNIFLIRQDDADHDFVKLLDFGISKIIDQSAELAATKLTSTGTVMGTPLYMAPEQAMGTTTDQRADIYALGVILYEMLAGTPPFAGVTYPVLVVKLLTADPELLSEVRPGLPPALVAAVHRALEKEPTNRFDTCEAFAAALTGQAPPEAKASAKAAIALDQTMDSRQVVAASPSALERASSLQPPTSAVSSPDAVPRSRTPLMLGAAGVVIVALVAVIVVLARAPAPAAAPPAITSAPIAIAPVGADAAVAPVAPVDATLELALVPDAPPTPTKVNKPPTSRPGMTVAPTSTTPPSSLTPPPPTTTTPPIESEPATPPATPSTPPPAKGGQTIVDVAAAIKRHDGKGCRAALAALSTPPASDVRVLNLHAICEMVAGNCAGGEQELRAVYTREGTPPDSAKFSVDLYCPPGDDPDTRLRRISKQISSSTYFDCAYFLEPTRASAKVASSARDRQIVGSLLAQIAACYSKRDRCDVARAVLAEAQVFIPALALNELKASCR